MSFEKDLMDQMKSWETGYISPSAQMLFKQARELLEDKLDEIAALKARVAELETKPVSKKNAK